jgi:hypothetical protein
MVTGRTRSVHRAHSPRHGRRRTGRLYRRGAPHRRAHRRPYELVAGALSSDPERSIASGRELGLREDRCYGSFEEMARRESRLRDGIEAVAIVTPNHMHFPGRQGIPAARHPRHLRQAADRQPEGSAQTRRAVENPERSSRSRTTTPATR